MTFDGLILLVCYPSVQVLYELYLPDEKIANNNIRELLCAAPGWVTTAFNVVLNNQRLIVIISTNVSA